MSGAIKAYCYRGRASRPVFMLAGSRHHKVLEEAAELLGLPAEIALNIDRDIFDLLEPEEWCCPECGHKEGE